MQWRSLDDSLGAGDGTVLHRTMARSFRRNRPITEKFRWLYHSCQFRGALRPKFVQGRIFNHSSIPGKDSSQSLSCPLPSFEINYLSLGRRMKNGARDNIPSVTKSIVILKIIIIQSSVLLCYSPAG